jgi:type II secretory pathway pseudopilin PulG
MMKIESRKLKIENQKLASEFGFTLIEIMVATVITMMIIGSVYAAFRTSLKVYQNDETKIIMLQRVRAALDRIGRDLSNLFYIADDEELTLLAEDLTDSQTEVEVDKDMISFTAIVQPRLEDYYMAMEQSGELLLDEEEENPLPSDLARIIYYIGPSPEDETVLSLMRVETSTLDTEELQDLLEGLMSSTPTEETIEDLGLQGVHSAALIDYVAGLNLRYFDGDDWVDTWDVEEEGHLPGAVEITLTVTDAETQEKTLTQALVVYLPMSDVYSEETEAAAGVTGGMGASR